MLLALATGKFDLTFTSELTPELMKDCRNRRPPMQCVVQATGTQGNLLVNRERPPFDNAQIRKAMVLAIDRKAFSDILSRGMYQGRRRQCCRRPKASGAGRKEFMETVPGYGADVEKSREEGRRIMRALGYGPDKMLPLKVTTRNIPDYRDAAVILIDHLKIDLHPRRTGTFGLLRLVRPPGAQGLRRRHERPRHRHRRSRRAVLRELPVWLRTQLHVLLQRRTWRSCSTSSRR